MAALQSLNHDLIQRVACARIPTAEGEFQLCLYRSSRDGKEHLALIMGDIAGSQNLLVRVHSECFTGDVLGSRRCDCGEQLHLAMRKIAEEGRGAVLYLRQEGRGIGLGEKLRAYNLQDQGYDTVDANLMLGHGADERDYSIAALILEDLGVRSVRLMTNNPAKIESLQALGIPVVERIPLQAPVHPENSRYLRTKVERMHHMLELPEVYLSRAEKPEPPQLVRLKQRLEAAGGSGTWENRPFVTLSYAQSLDGSIAVHRKERAKLSGSEAMVLTHRLRAAHDAILIGIGTALADDPRLTVRLVEGANPQPVLLDCHLRLPLNARLLRHPDRQLWIATTAAAPASRRRELERAGARIFELPANSDGHVDLGSLLVLLKQRGIRHIMVEGGAEVISSFLHEKLVDQLVVTVAPRLLGGLPAITRNGVPLPVLGDVSYQQLGRDLILWARPLWEEQLNLQKEGTYDVRA